MKFIKFYSLAFFKMKILCKFTSFLNFLFWEAVAAAPRRDGNKKYTAAAAPRRPATVMINKLPLPRVRRRSGSAAMDISAWSVLPRNMSRTHEGTSPTVQSLYSSDSVHMVDPIEV